MTRAEHIASFIGTSSGEALFVGLYKNTSTKVLDYDAYWNLPAYVEMRAMGMRGLERDDDRQAILWFDLDRTSFYADWSGKLVVGWPPPDRSWWRWADRNRMPVLAVHEESVLVPSMPEWDELVLDWSQIAVLPSTWRQRFSQWRGIYYIHDVSDEKGYVGSAYGEDNILGRWLNYGSTGHGGNRLLRGRDPANLRFSILQRLSPDMPAADVIRHEVTWKDRLHTRAPGGLNEN
jgi:hypothetical protein